MTPPVSCPSGARIVPTLERRVGRPGAAGTTGWDDRGAAVGHELGAGGTTRTAGMSQSAEWDDSGLLGQPGLPSTCDVCFSPTLAAGQCAAALALHLAKLRGPRLRYRVPQQDALGRFWRLTMSPAFRQ